MNSSLPPISMQDQYMFIHDAVLEQLVCGDTQIQASGLNRTLPRLLQPQQKSDGSFKTGLAVQFDVSSFICVLLLLSVEMFLWHLSTHPYLTLGAHAQRGLRYLGLSVRLYRVFCHHAQQTGKIATPTGSALHRLHFKNSDFRKSAAFRSYGLKTK